MLLGQTNPDKRHVGPLRVVTDVGDPVVGDDFSNATIELSVGGGALVAALGAMVEIGSGYYYYLATAADALVGPWVTVRITGASMATIPLQEFTLREDVALQLGGIIAGETDPDLLVVGPLRFVDADGNPLGAADIAGATKEITVNGTALTAPLGTFTCNDPGYLFYTADPTEVVEDGWIGIRISGTCQEEMFREDIVTPVLSVAGSVLSLTNGSLGRWTPVTARIQLDGGSMFVRYVSNSLSFWLYDATDGFTNNFKERSSVEQVDDELIFTILPNGGWWTNRFNLKFVAGIELAQE